VSSALSRSSADPVSEALAAAVDAIVAALRASPSANPVVLIDGRSGAGKTSLTARLRARWPLPVRPCVIALDSLYPGWGGLQAGVEYARDAILLPHRRGLVGVWHRWDWERGTRAEAHEVDPSSPLIVEGAGLLTTATAELGDVRVWVDAPLPSRRSRAIGRDGDAYLPHWDTWAAQEEAHLLRDDPMDLADIVLDVP
jgi:hypothetical protein